MKSVKEARIMAEEMGCEVITAYDFGVAGIHRLFERKRAKTRLKPPKGLENHRED